jgi:hypothetical protein
MLRGKRKVRVYMVKGIIVVETEDVSSVLTTEPRENGCWRMAATII